ncbi:EAL domain-containing protein [Anaerotignum sp.]|uniref:EAL domain-containing protein n=1 Tax=Anaerotignum sp. TaxID=2039241 RepID=UPI0028A68F73|nr:EAL domain-containing protein [Anaerotignum sp.]
MSDKTILTPYKADYLTFLCKYKIGDMECFKCDNEKFQYDKLCMIKIENADLLLSFFGDEKYCRHLEKSCMQIHNYMRNNGISGILSPYMMDRSTFLIAGKPDVKEELYFSIIKKLYRKFHFVKPTKTDPPIVVRFCVVLNNENMLDCAIKQLNATENAQKNYIICNKQTNSSKSLKQELKVLDIIHWAIQNNQVVPYYQGIYDNKKKCIEKYESLMRIIDSNGTVHSPESFMGTAKKYHLYSKLSEIMISRVLHEVDDLNMAVSINLSAYDINSVEFKEGILKLLENRKSKALLVFEILEDEIFKDIVSLQNFIQEVNKYGVRIAIDDFGSGYSNLAEIAQISPHYIKIDGNIILKMNDSFNNRAILESIVSLCKKTNIFTVAEHVENKKIQESIEELNIDFSQGYYFAKPVPITDLKLN